MLLQTCVMNLTSHQITLLLDKEMFQAKHKQYQIMFSTMIVIANIGVLFNANELEQNVGQLIDQNVSVWDVLTSM